MPVTEENSAHVYNHLISVVGRTPTQAARHGSTNPLTTQGADADRPWPWDKMEQSTGNRAAYMDTALKMIHTYKCRITPPGPQQPAIMQAFEVPD